MRLSSLHLALGAALCSPTLVLGLSATDADTMWNAYNNVFLNQNGGNVYYQKRINDTTPDPNWPGSFDIFVAQDVYQRKGDNATKALVNNLVNTWLKNTPPRPYPPWHWDGWNDDLGWYTLGLIRGYQITGNPSFLTEAMAGFDYAFSRGWNTTFNDGGIWEQNPEYITDGSEPDKQALSCDSLGKVACMIYQSTHNATYLNRCQQIYSWVHSHLYDSQTGQIQNSVLMNGTIVKSKEAYNQGTFLDYANLLWKITGDVSYFNDAKLAVAFGFKNITVNGIFSNTADYLNSWADEFARGAGNFVNDNNMWGTYYSSFVNNSDAILQNRRSDLGITWNGWNKPTPSDNGTITNKFVSAVAWLQYTPPTQPGAGVVGIRTITNNKTGLAIDSTGTWGNGSSVLLDSKASGQAQRWLLTQNDVDQTWNVINLATWQALQSADGSKPDGNTAVQWQPTRNPNQRWTIEKQTDGTFKIWNTASNLALDGGSSTSNGAPLAETKWTGATSQRWNII